MIDAALAFLQGQLNKYLKLKTGDDGVVHLTNLTNDSGKVVLDEVGMMLVNLEEEKMMRNQNPYQPGPDGSFEKVSPEVNLNLTVLFAANFGESEEDYLEGLHDLSLVGTFFQSRNMFTPRTHPDLDPGIARLVVELQSLTFEQQSQLWSYLGGGYFPSLIYKVRMVTLQEKEIQSAAPPITEVNLFD